MSEATLSLSGLFLSALLSSTLLPGGSEAAIIWLDQQALYNNTTLLLVATAGNTLGGVITWGMGGLAMQKWGGVSQKQPLSPRASRWIKRHGAPALLLSWLPLIGDGLCLAAGWFRIGLLPALLFIMIGKAARYALLLWVV